MISERLREGRTAGTDLRWHVTDIHREAADVIDALVAALDTFVSEYVELVNSGDAGFWEPEDEPKVKAARAALALSRRK